MNAQGHPAAGPTLSDLSPPVAVDRSEVERLRAELTEMRERLEESRGELARLVRLAEADLGRRRPGERSSATLSVKRRPAPEEVGGRIAQFVRLATAPRGWRKPSIRREQMLALLQGSGLFDPQYYLEVNTDLAANGMDAGRHYLDYGMNEGRLPSRL